MASEEITPTETSQQEKTTAKIDTAENVEKAQEEKLRAKYPALKGPGSSAFLQKRLFQGQKKYFDSGDYNMAKAKMGGGGGGGAPARSAMPPPASQPPSAAALFLPGPVGSAIPTPESVAHRKPSLIQSKLAAAAGQT